MRADWIFLLIVMVRNYARKNTPNQLRRTEYYKRLLITGQIKMDAQDLTTF